MKKQFLSFKSSIIDSFHCIKNARNLVILSMLLALSIILGIFSIKITEYLKIGFSFIATALTGYLFGPVAGGIFGAVADILKFITNPSGAFFPGFTLNEIITGILYGFILYRKPVTIKRTLAAKFCVTVIVNLGLTTYWLSIMSGNAFMILFPLRAFKNALSFPFEALMLYGLLKVLQRIPEFRKLIIQNHK